MKKHLILTTIAAFAVAAISAHAQDKPKNVEVTIDGVAGFQDTPLQPDGKWHVHDPARPQPPVVTPGSTFSQQAAPPSDAVVLFNGKDLSNWRDRKGGEAPWRVEDGVMVSAKSDIETTDKFGDIQLHLEFKEPNPGKGEGQGRGNSGVFFMGLYEIQVLDCYQNKTYADGATGGIYGQHPALANACRPPGEWQTYDIIFTAPHFGDKGEVISPAYVTVTLNGVVVQNHQAIRGATNWKSPGKYTAHAAELPIALQYHNNSVSFRNIWARPVPLVNDP
ncbi:MAG TPA: DUF1080 domain-containing protein [Candidatus Acidoferrales bacterium]|jgi:hypothetical protein|nr:DUF1080 domain-containing protein [Candidatus Acidoferrales bacterium]